MAKVYTRGKSTDRGGLIEPTYYLYGPIWSSSSWKWPNDPFADVLVFIESPDEEGKDFVTDQHVVVIPETPFAVELVKSYYVDGKNTYIKVTTIGSEFPLYDEIGHTLGRNGATLGPAPADASAARIGGGLFHGVAVQAIDDPFMHWGEKVDAFPSTLSKGKRHDLGLSGYVPGPAGDVIYHVARFIYKAWRFVAVTCEQPFGDLPFVDTRGNERKLTFWPGGVEAFHQAMAYLVGEIGGFRCLPPEFVLIHEYGPYWDLRSNVYLCLSGCPIVPFDPNISTKLDKHRYGQSAHLRARDSELIQLYNDEVWYEDLSIWRPFTSESWLERSNIKLRNPDDPNKKEVEITKWMLSQQTWTGTAPMSWDSCAEIVWVCKERIKQAHSVKNIFRSTPAMFAARNPIGNRGTKLKQDEPPSYSEMANAVGASGPVVVPPGGQTLAANPVFIPPSVTWGDYAYYSHRHVLFRCVDSSGNPLDITDYSLEVDLIDSKGVVWQAVDFDGPVESGKPYGVVSGKLGWINYASGAAEPMYLRFRFLSTSGKSDPYYFTCSIGPLWSTAIPSDDDYAVGQIIPNSEAVGRLTGITLPKKWLTHSTLLSPSLIPWDMYQRITQRLPEVDITSHYRPETTFLDYDPVAPAAGGMYPADLSPEPWLSVTQFMASGTRMTGEQSESSPEGRGFWWQLNEGAFRRGWKIGYHSKALFQRFPLPELVTVFDLKFPPPSAYLLNELVVGSPEYSWEDILDNQVLTTVLGCDPNDDEDKKKIESLKKRIVKRFRSDFRATAIQVDVDKAAFTLSDYGQAVTAAGPIDCIDDVIPIVEGVTDIYEWQDGKKVLKTLNRRMVGTGLKYFTLEAKDGDCVVRTTFSVAVGVGQTGVVIVFVDCLRAPWLASAQEPNNFSGVGNAIAFDLPMSHMTAPSLCLSGEVTLTYRESAVVKAGGPFTILSARDVGDLIEKAIKGQLDLSTVVNLEWRWGDSNEPREADNPTVSYVFGHRVPSRRVWIPPSPGSYHGEWYVDGEVEIGSVPMTTSTPIVAYAYRVEGGSSSLNAYIKKQIGDGMYCLLK